METNTFNATPEASTPTEASVQFINQEVLAPPTTSPMAASSKLMIDQATGMMAQDLQSFLKGFEQISLVAISRLANNILTYGTYFHQGATSADKTSENLSKTVSPGNPADPAKGYEALHGLFSMVNEYAKNKAVLTSPSSFSGEMPQTENSESASISGDDDEKKKNS